MNLPVLFMLLLLATAGYAHEGHDHGGDAPLPASTVAPRFETRSDLFELVGIMDGEVLWLYLDKADSNEPITQAAIEIESSAFKGKALASPDGVFRLTAPALAKPGQHVLTVSVEAGEDADLLTARFEMNVAGTNTAEPANAAKGLMGKGILWIGGALLLVLLSLMVFRKKKRT